MCFGAIRQGEVGAGFVIFFRVFIAFAYHKKIIADIAVIGIEDGISKFVSSNYAFYNKFGTDQRRYKIRTAGADSSRAVGKIRITDKIITFDNIINEIKSQEV